MTWATAVVLIVLISAVAGVLRARYGGSHRLRRGHDHAPQLPSAREEALQREVEDLRERIHVLERIATDGGEAKRIASEIEQLRDK